MKQSFNNDEKSLNHSRLVFKKHFSEVKKMPITVLEASKPHNTRCESKLNNYLHKLDSDIKHPFENASGVKNKQHATMIKNSDKPTHNLPGDS